MAESPRRLYLLDASTYIFRAFHSTNPRTGKFPTSLSTSAGMPTNALLVFTNMVRKLCRDHKPSYFAAVFDPPSDKTFRNETYALYKANRSETPADLKVQFPFFRPIVRGLGLSVLEHAGYEADDVIATLARRGREAGWEVVIISSDKDLYQLLHPGVEMYDSMKDRWIDRAAVDKKFGVAPDKVTQVQGLIGDSVDNIPGIPGVGPKTAAKLIGSYANLEGIYEHLDELKGKLLERLIEHRESAFLSRDLATLREDVPLTETLEEMAVQPADADELARIFADLEFKTLLREYQKTSEPAKDVLRRTVSTPEDLQALVDRLQETGSFAMTVLLSEADYMQAELVGLALAPADHESWYVPVGHRYLGAPEQLSQTAVLTALAPILADPKQQRLAHCYKELAVLLARTGHPLGAVAVDVELASYLVNPTKYAHTLDNIALDHLDQKLPELPKAIEKKRESWSTAEVAHAATYAQSRVEAIRAVTPILTKELGTEKVRSLFDELELPLSRVLALMETAGVRVDPDVLTDLSNEFSERLSRLEGQCHSLAGTPFNPGSPKQLADVLFNRLGLPILKKTKTGASTDASVLDQLKDRHPIIPAVLEWRSLQKLKGTYTDVLPALVHPETKRIHTNFRQAVAATGRLSSYAPNLQNIPIRTPAGRRIRDAFVPAPGCQLLSADYSQIELRILAHLADDPGLQRAFHEDRDIHQLTASEIFDVRPEQVTGEQRSAAKAINFGLMYGMGAFRLGRDLHISQDEAKSYIARYFERYPAVKSYMDGTVERGRELGYVETLLGRRRYVPELQSKNRMRRTAAERAAINAPVQGTAADLIKLAMLRVADALSEAGLKARMVLQVHDELVFDAPTEEIDALQALVVREMEGVYTLKVPLRVSAATGNNWNEAH